MTHDLIRRLTDGLDIDEDVARRLFARVTPVVLLEDLDPYPSRQPKWKHCIGGTVVGAVAGNYSMAQLRCPPGNMIVVIDRVWATCSAGSIAYLYQDAGAGYTTLRTTRMNKDQRLTGAAGGYPWAEVRDETNVAHQGTAARVAQQCQPSAPIYFDGPYVLDGGATGTAIGVELSVVNTTLGFMVEWRERVRVGSEI